MTWTYLSLKKDESPDVFIVQSDGCHIAIEVSTTSPERQRVNVDGERE